MAMDSGRFGADKGKTRVRSALACAPGDETTIISALARSATRRRRLLRAVMVLLPPFMRRPRRPAPGRPKAGVRPNRSYPGGTGGYGADVKPKMSELPKLAGQSC